MAKNRDQTGELVDSLGKLQEDIDKKMSEVLPLTDAYSTALSELKELHKNSLKHGNVYSGNAYGMLYRERTTVAFDIVKVAKKLSPKKFYEVVSVQIGKLKKHLSEGEMDKCVSIVSTTGYFE